MRGNARENTLQTNSNLDDSRSFRTIGNQDKSRQEDSNASLLNSADPLRLNTNEDSSYIRFRRTSRPSIQTNNRKVSPAGVGIKRSNSRHQNKDSSSPTSRNSIESPNKFPRQENSNILGGMSCESRGDMDLYLQKNSSTPLGFGEVDNMIDQANFQMDGQKTTPAKMTLPKPADLGDYTAQDFLEEQDVVHSLRIKNQNSKVAKRDQWNQNEEDSKEESPTNDRERFNQAYQRVSLRLRLKKNNSNSLEIDVGNDNSTSERRIENASAQGTSFKQPYSELVEVTSDQDRTENLSRNMEGGDTSIVSPPPQQQEQQQAASSTTTTATANPAPQGPGRAVVHRVIATPYIQRKVALFLATTFSSLFLALRLLDKLGTELVMIPVYGYFIYMAFQKAKAAYRTQGLAHWYRLENKLQYYNSLGYILTILLLNLRIGEVIPISVIAAIPLILTNAYYAFKTEVQQKEKRINLVLNVLVIFQTILLTIKLDHIIDMEWAYALIICLMFFGTTISTCFIQVFYAVFLVYLIRTENYQDRAFSRKELFLGIFWQFLYFGLGGVGALVSIGIIVLYDPHGGPELLYVSAWMGFVLSIILSIFTSLYYKPLIKFRMYFNADRLMGLAEPEPAPKPVIKFEVEQKKSYFINMSSTYFIPLTKDFLTKNKPDIEKIKNMFKDSKLGKAIASRHETRIAPSFKSPVNRETLHKYKETLDGKFNNVLNGSQKSAQYASAAIHRFLKILSPRHDSKSPKPIREFGVIDDNNDRHDLCLSVDNIRDIEMAYASPKNNTHRDDEKLCYLCYANPPDCVLMNCGHGGICYECALAAVKLKNECVECRAKVETIHKIDPESKVAGVVKSVEISKVILENASS